MCGAREQKLVMWVDWDWSVMAQTYPFLLTTSSFASCRQMLLRVPIHRVNILADLLRHQSRAHHDCDCWKSDVVVVDGVRWMQIECGA